MDFRPEMRFAPSENIAWREVNQEVVILNMKSGEYYTLNDVGQTVWLAAAEGVSIADIKKRLISEFEVSPEQAENDITFFIKDLIKEGLLHEST